jgi:SAM-dependent methyltransferase
VSRSDPPAGGDAGLQLRVLESLESARNYNAWTSGLALPYLGDDPVEIGSGLGGNAALWLRGGVPCITVSDVEPAALEHLRERFGGDPRVEVAELDLLDAPERAHTGLVAMNVLEHVEDDVAALRGAARLVRPGGHVVIFVPAFPFALGRFDRAIGHHRRYTRDTLGSAFRRAGLDVVDLRYVNLPGLPAWFVGMRLLGLTPRDGLALRLWDRLVIPPARALESRLRPPFGQSVLGVGRRPVEMT